MTKMRKPDPGESWVSRWLVRPIVHAAFQFSSEARFIRRTKKRTR